MWSQSNCLFPCSKVLLKKLIFLRKEKKYFPLFHETQDFIAIFTRPRYGSLSRHTRIRSMSSYPIYVMSTVVMSPCLRLFLLSFLFSSGFSTKPKIYFCSLPYFLSDPSVSLFWLTIPILFGEENRLISVSLSSFLQSLILPFFETLVSSL